MALGQAIYRQGEKAPLYVTEQAAVGTVQFSAAPTFSLWDVAGNLILPATAAQYTSTPASVIQAYYDLDTSALSGGYYGRFALPIQAQDGITRIRVYDYDIYVYPADQTL